ncbi:MAG: primosomal protein N', partial [Bacteroidales bacterium]|nr:primosomal protein N' [Bacteroidales bacterium]
TQMVSKGLDFDHVRVVGILNADTMLNYPDFRSYERAFQLMAQVSGRAGRRGKRGRVILQTRNIEHPIINQVIQNDYCGMVKDQLNERKLFHYPPFYRLIYIYLRHQNESLVRKMAHLFANELYRTFGSRVLGPDNPPVGRVQRFYIQKIIVKIESNSSIKQATELLHEIERSLSKDIQFRSIRIHYDVDPM